MIMSYSAFVPYCVILGSVHLSDWIDCQYCIVRAVKGINLITYIQFFKSQYFALYGCYNLDPTSDPLTYTDTHDHNTMQDNKIFV